MKVKVANRLYQMGRKEYEKLRDTVAKKRGPLWYLCSRKRKLCGTQKRQVRKYYPAQKNEAGIQVTGI